MDCLNRQQREAVDAKGHTVIVACPGSGKTRVLVERAAALSIKRPNAHIILVTFTRQAAAELRKRLEERVASLAHLRVSTFHSLALQQLLSNKDARICGPSEQVALLRRAAAGTLSDSLCVANSYFAHDLGQNHSLVIQSPLATMLALCVI